jgi:microcompartment protein CcmK/EutM
LLVGRVIGSVVATRKEAELDGLKLLLVENTDPDGKPKGTFVVAADAVGAGAGDLILYATGSSARQTAITRDRPLDAVIMAIVDLIEEQGTFRYRKDSE